jgi:hypothetical protein
MTRHYQPQGRIEPGYGWFGQEYRAVWRVYIDGRLHGVMSSPRRARRSLRHGLRQARRQYR